jgi:hypothetical protein
MDVDLNGQLSVVSLNSSVSEASEKGLKLYQILPNFISKHVREYLDALGDVKTLKPDAKEGFAAVVMVDVSGYSKLTDTLSERGAYGAEILSRIMKDYLDKVFISKLF